MKANHVTIGMSLGAIIMSSVALYRSTETSIPTDQVRRSASSQSGGSYHSNVFANEQRRPAMDGGSLKIEKRVHEKQLGVTVSGHGTPKRADEQWHISYRGSEKVIDIGEPKDPHSDRLDYDAADEVLQIGKDLQAELD